MGAKNRKEPSPDITSDDKEIGERASLPASEGKPLWKCRSPTFLLMLLLPALVFFLSGRSPSLYQLCNCEARGEARAKQGSQSESLAYSSKKKNCSFASSNMAKDNYLGENVAKDCSVPQETITKGMLLGGLLAAGFDERSCLSRYRSALYRRESPHLPSPYLLERLRKQEALQRKCGPGTELYNKAIDVLKPNHSIETPECKYVVWLSHSGLGNRMMSLSSTFLYALLSNRVLLVDRGDHTAALFCEPFPNSSWLVPLDFPLLVHNKFAVYHPSSPERFGSMLQKNKTTSDVSQYVYLHLIHNADHFDHLFFCDDVQQALQKITWQLLNSNQYFVPGFFLTPMYEEELGRLFPEKVAVFHHLGRYLFHPTNPVWGLITRSYHSYLAKADERVGLQIRVFDGKADPRTHLERIIPCVLEEKLLPNISLEESVVSSAGAKSKVVLVASLNSAYFEKFRSMYWEHPTATGEIIRVYQPSHEGVEQTGKGSHELKAWAEMYLLSFSDVLVTSTWSTFGYAAQGLGGLKPWIALAPGSRSCVRDLSMEPCYHFPPSYDCRAKTSADLGALVPYMRHCVDMTGGVKLVDPAEH